VQLDEIRFKRWHQVVGWMALALEVPTRLWLGGAVSEHRDAALVRRVVEPVKRASSALGRGLLLVTDGLATYVKVIKTVFREPMPTGQPGRPPLIEWPRLHIPSRQTLCRRPPRPDRAPSGARERRSP
jgi:hypothetical protein